MLKDAAARVASGDLSQAIQVTGDDEVTQVQQSVRTMQSTLRDALQNIQGSATQLASNCSTSRTSMAMLVTPIFSLILVR
ncbi:HAMP domain-containing protein [Pseudomonas reinekei]|uniref:HAMP domain-containing protein n=1 Tax=Pseudomonas reinekei TaxID=395598 RepID=UPI0022B25DCB|nr:HAMP domain-containing protein [Pseudomonas reinekei]